MTYEITVNGIPIIPEEIRVSAFPFNRVWPGKQRDIDQSEIAYMVRIIDDSPQFIRIESKTDFDSLAIRPLGKGIKAVREGNAVSFKLEEHGCYTVEFDGENHAIHQA